MASLSERIYFASPIWLQQVYVAAYGWWWYRRRYGKRFHELVAELKARDRWTSEQFHTYQEERLARLFKAARRSPYYQQVFAEAGMTPDMPAFEALRRLPLLSKETLRTRPKELLTQDPPRGTTVFKSSGTTGTPTEIYYTSEFHQLEMAMFEARSRYWAGVTYRDRRVMFGVRKVCHFDQDKPPFWRLNPAENMAYMSIYHLSPQFMPAYLSFLREYQPELIMGYPSALGTLAQFALDNDDLPAPAEAVITTSETVTPTIRQAVEEAWQCELYDSYGAVEGCMLACQCEYGRYHISPDIGIYEILDAEGNPCEPGQMGEAVCTGLYNTLQPLIRYRIGDLAVWSTEEDCPCGRHMPLLQSVEGRVEDMCYTRDGRAMLRFDTVFKGVQNIRQAQVVQEALDRFVVYVVPGNGYGEHDAQKIRSNMCLHVGDVETRVIPVSTIERGSGGKFRAVICRLSPAERAWAQKRARQEVPVP